MSVRVTKPLPSPRTLIAAEEQGARLAMKDAQQALRPLINSDTPKRSGQTAAALQPRLGRTRTGVSLTVGAPRGRRHTPGNATIADVVRYINRGTGLYRDGPGPKRKIRAKNPLRRMTLPGGAKRFSVKGQHPDPFMARIQAAATPRVLEAAQEGAVKAARLVEGVFH